MDYQSQPFDFFPHLHPVRVTVLVITVHSFHLTYSGLRVLIHQILDNSNLHCPDIPNYIIQKNPYCQTSTWHSQDHSLGQHRQKGQATCLFPPRCYIIYSSAGGIFLRDGWGRSRSACRVDGTQLQEMDARLQTNEHNLIGLANNVAEILRILKQPSQSLSHDPGLQSLSHSPGSFLPPISLL